ncbi:hypothetical protein [Kribbella endophytica]
MTLDLAVSVLTADRAVRLAAPAVVAGDDPFRLDVPPLVDPGTADIDAAALDALAGLYLTAELEQTGLLVAVELLVANRASLDLTSVEAAELLEDVASAAREWLPVAARQQLFARVFGTASAASFELINRDFPQLLSDLCSAITAYDEAESWNRPPPSHLRSQISRAVGRMRENLALRQYGATLVVGRRITEQVRRSVEVISHPGIVALVRGRSPWDVVRATWEPNEQPDIEGLVGQGQSGQVVIAWTGTPADVPPQQVRDAAATWLLHAGLEQTWAA